MSLYTLTKADGQNPLYDRDETTGQISGVVEVLSLGLAWERKGGIGEDTGIGKAKSWLKRKQREAQGQTDPADLDAAALFFVGDKPTKYLGLDDFEPFKDEATTREKQSAIHSGDSVQGAGDGDDEKITLKLLDLPQRFTKVLLVVGAFKPGSDIMAAHDIKATVYDGTGGSEQAVAQIEPSLLEDKDILAIASVIREMDGQGRPTGQWLLEVADTSFNIEKGNIRSLLRQSINAF
jgi:stress response protein SCP2